MYKKGAVQLLLPLIIITVLIVGGWMYVSSQKTGITPQDETLSAQAISSVPVSTNLAVQRPTDDSLVRERNPATNFGKANRLIVDNVDPKLGQRVVSYIKFTVSNWSSSYSGARLRLYVTNPTTNGPYVYAVSNSWTETTVTWNKRPARIQAKPIADIGASGAGKWIEIDISSQVKGNGIYSFEFESDVSNGVQFESREGVNKPQLVLIPTTIIREAAFTTTSNDRTIERKIIDLIHNAKAGSVIRIAMYTFTDRAELIDALTSAYTGTKKVNVHVILDKENKFHEPALTKLRAKLPAANITVCGSSTHGGCLGKHINHNKFVLISELTNGDKNVVVQSSANFTNNQLSYQNNALIIKNDKALYDGYVSYWNDLKRKVYTPGYNRIVSSPDTKVYMSPRNSGDPVAAFLNSVTCPASPKSVIRIAASFWSLDRDASLLKMLTTKKNQGCDVQMIVRSDAEALKGTGTNTIRASGVKTYIYPVNESLNLHHKYLIVDGDVTLNGVKKRRKMVLTGSHNYTNASLTQNDDILFQLENSTLYGAYSLNWNKIVTQTKPF